MGKPLHPLPAIHPFSGGQARDDDLCGGVLRRQLRRNRTARLPENVGRTAQAQAAGGPKIRNEGNVCDPGILVSERTHPGDGLRKPRALIRPFDGDPRDVRALTEPKLEELRVFRPSHPQRTVATQGPRDDLVDRRILRVA